MGSSGGEGVGILAEALEVAGVVGRGRVGLDRELWWLAWIGSWA